MFFVLSNPFTAPLRALLVFLADQADRLPLPGSVSPYAIAIVAVAVLVKLATQPLMSQQQTSMRRMQELQPKLSEIQKKYKDDREKLSQAQMELYREHGVNPFGGCLPLVVQMVVLFGLYRAIMSLAGTPATATAPAQHGPMFGQPFLWIPNLAACEPSPLCGQATAVLPVAIPILLVLMVISQFYYQRLMTPPTRAADPQQQSMNQMMKLMPLMFAWIFIKLPAGLLLYYTTFNLVALAQQSVTQRLRRPGSPSLAGLVTGASVAEEAPGDEVAEAQEEQTTHEGATTGRRRRRKKGR